MRKTGKEQDNEAVKAQVSQPGSLGVLCCVLCYQSQKPISNKENGKKENNIQSAQACSDPI